MFTLYNVPILLRKGLELVDQQTPFDEKVYGETATKVQILKQEDFCLKSHNKKWEISLDEIIPNSTILTIELRCIFLFKFRNSNLCSNRSNAGNFQSAAHPVFHLICLHFLYFLHWKHFFLNKFVSFFCVISSPFCLYSILPYPSRLLWYIHVFVRCGWCYMIYTKDPLQKEII